MTHPIPSRRSVLALLATLALPATAAAQPQPSRPRPQPARPPARPAAPPAAPARPRPAEPPREAPAPAVPAPVVLPRGLEELPAGGWRVRFAPEEQALSPELLTALGEIGGRLAALPAGRIAVSAQVGGSAADVSTVRRLSLARGIVIRNALVAGGLPFTRVDVRPLGRTADSLDVVDVVPPDPQRPPR